jgi:hypothetical protein
MPINSFLYPGAKVTLGYEVANSLRFDDGSSDYLSITPSSASNRKTFTFSTWFKRSSLTNTEEIFYVNNSSSDRSFIEIGDTDSLLIQNKTSGTKNVELTTNRKFRDTSAWYHIVVSADTTQGTDSNRVKLYINGVQETSFSTETYPSQNTDFFVNNNVEHSIGRRIDNNSNFFNGYLAETVLVDGSQLDPTSFGEFDEDSPTIWKPKDVSGLTFGTNGFYLEFKQSGTSQNSSGLGADTSGNDNHFASNNLAATDQSTDTCTNNFATFNPAAPTTDITLSEGNLKGVYGTSGTRTVQTSTFGLSSGKWYWEIKIGGSTSPNNAMVGITQLSTDTNTVLGTADNSWAYRGYDGKVYHNNADEGGSLDTFTDGDIIGIALNLDNLQGSLHKLYFSKNGTFQNGADPTDFTSTTGVYGVDDNVDYFPAVSDAGSSATPQFEINFGSPSFSISSGNSDANGYGNFEYAVPSGFYALNTKNLAEFG